MSLLASQPDFEPANSTEGASASYYQPHDGTGYHNNLPHFQTRVGHLKGRYAPTGQKLAVWGCGFGQLVNLAVEVGYDAFGFDASEYAIRRGGETQPANVAAHLFQRDALSATDVTASRQDAGLKGNTRFALLVTEDLLPCMSDEEVQTALPLLRGSCSTALLHIVTPLDPTTWQDARLNWKTVADWKTLIAPGYVYDATTGQVV